MTHQKHLDSQFGGYYTPLRQGMTHQKLLDMPYGGYYTPWWKALRGISYLKSSLNQTKYLIHPLCLFCPGTHLSRTAQPNIHPEKWHYINPPEGCTAHHPSWEVTLHQPSRGLHSPSSIARSDITLTLQKAAQPNIHPEKWHYINAPEGCTAHHPLSILVIVPLAVVRNWSRDLSHTNCTN